jgi:hypothetical protein
MKKAVLRLVGKAVLAVSPFLWNRKAKWAFNLHQKLGRFAINLDRKHNLDLWDEAHLGEDLNRF